MPASSFDTRLITITFASRNFNLFQSIPQSPDALTSRTPQDVSMKMVRMSPSNFRKDDCLIFQRAKLPRKFISHEDTKDTEKR